MSGYIGTLPTPQATQTRDVFTATASQTTFATSGYTVGFLDVYVNGVHLQNGTDYTATNGSDVVMSSGLTAGDYVEVVAFTTFSTSDTVSASGGGTFSGDVSFGDNVKAKFGSSNDLEVYHDGNDSYVDDTGTGALILRGNSNVTIGKYTGETMGFFEADGAAYLYHDNSIKMQTSSNGISVTGSDYQLRLNQGSNQPYFIRHASDNSLRMHLNGTGDRLTIDSNGTLNGPPSANFDIKTGSGTGDMRFFTNGSQRAGLDASGNLLVSTTSTFDSQDNSNGSVNRLCFIPASSGLHLEANNTAPLLLKRNSGNGTIVAFNRGGSTGVGSISVTTSSTSYNTSSDYRLKENVADIADGITRVKQLAPKRFNFIVDADTTVDGFLAHEAQAVVPESVTGTHNEVDADGNAVMQGIDQAKLVPLLTAALQEAITKIETLETENVAIKARLDALEAE